MTRVAVAALVGLLLASSARTEERALAWVDGQPLAAADLERDFGRRHSGHMAFLAGEEEIRRALDGLIDRTLLLDEAERLELDTRPEVAGAGEDLAHRLAIEHLLTTEISEPAQPSEEEIRAAWEEHADELYRVRQIVVPARTEADEIAARLAAGESFEELARERSRAPSGRNGGQLPPVRWGSLGADWDAVVVGLAAGAVSEPFWNGEGWELVQMVERLPVERPEYERAREVVKGALLQANLARRQRELSERLFAKYGVEVSRRPDDPAAWASAAASEPAAVVAAWRGGSLTLADLAAGTDLAALAALPGERAARELETQVRIAINERLAALEAEDRGYSAQPEIREAVARYHDEAMEAILHGEFIFRGIAVEDSEVRAWYDAHGDELTTPERRRVAQILVASEAEALAARRRLEAGEPFGEVAREVSLDQESAARGGELGWATEREHPPGFEPVLALAAGEVSPPLQTGLGWHLILVAEIEPPRRRGFDEAAEEVRTKLLREKRKAARERWLEQLRAAAEIEIDDAAVRAYAARAADR